MRWGILGCGDVTEVKSGPALQKAEGSALTAVMRRDAEKAADCARRHGVPFSTGNADELIARADVDAVYVAAPPGAHLDLALRVCAAGKPCYVEKPMARSAAESRAMLGAFAAAGVPLYVAFYRRGLSRFVTAKRLIDEGRLGTITGVSYAYAAPLPGDLDPANLPWRLRAEDAGAGIFYDIGSHLLDVLDFLLGPLTDVAGVAKNVAAPYAVEDAVAMSFVAAGAPSVALWDFAAPDRRDLIEVRGTEAKLSLSCLGAEPVRLEARGKEAEEFDGSLPPHVHQPLVQGIVDELRAVPGAPPCPSTGTTALRTMEVMDAVLSSFYGGREDAFWERPDTWPGRRRPHD